MKKKPQWLALYEDEARWLAALIERARHADWREDGDDLMVAMLAPRLLNLGMLYPRQPKRGGKR